MEMGWRIYRAANEPKQIESFPQGAHLDLFDHGAWGTRANPYGRTCRPPCRPLAAASSSYLDSLTYQFAYIRIEITARSGI
jgi:hypothetical protein